MPRLKCNRNGHSFNTCKNEVCANCDYLNTKYNLLKDTKHMSTDSHNCDIRKNKIKKVIAETDYPIKPTVPRFMGFKQIETVNGKE